MCRPGDTSRGTSPLLRARWRAFFSRPALRTLSSTSSSWALVWSRLKSHISQLTEERLAAGPAWSDSGYLFTTEVGEPLRPATVSLAFERAVGRAKVPAIRLQDLRHVSATLALLAGVPVHVVSARLGHADPAITLRVYSHCLPTSQRDAAARIGAQIYGSWVVLSATARLNRTFGERVGALQPSVYRAFGAPALFACT